MVPIFKPNSEQAKHLLGLLMPTRRMVTDPIAVLSRLETSVLWIKTCIATDMLGLKDVSV
jgi:hypothetical protein